MNIKEAKEQIKRAMIAYFSKDEFGNYEIPIEKQRPVFLLGAPGIGKTAIMKQIADELEVGLVSYSMTHHTRQSALGLPVIVKKEFQGESYDISEYTMSEIIASVYQTIETTGKKEGILFLDEINCVSETLAPSMLQFLQYKVFGSHRIPDGWIVVTAGNPPEYNKSVRNFDIVTLDRLKLIPVEPDYKAWKEYAVAEKIHPAILTYLDIKKDHFFRIESSASGKHFVTARGWEDLSKMLKLYEKHELPVDKLLISQYLQLDSIASDFSAYYDLFRKYEADYEIEQILNGQFSDEIKVRSRQAKFDERIAVLGLLLDAVTEQTGKVEAEQQTMLSLQKTIKEIKLQSGQKDVKELVKEEIRKLEDQLKKNRQTEQISKEKFLLAQRTLLKLNHYAENHMTESYENLTTAFRKDIEVLRELVDNTSNHLKHLFEYYEEVYPEGREMLLLVTELTVNPSTSQFISEYGCDKYYKHNKELLFYERNKDIITKLQKLELDAD